MAYVFHNLSDDKLAELRSAVHEESKRRFLSTASKYPKLLAVSDCGAAEATGAYRAAYNLPLTHAYCLYTHYHRHQED